MFQYSIIVVHECRVEQFDCPIICILKLVVPHDRG